MNISSLRDDEHEVPHQGKDQPPATAGGSDSYDRLAAAECNLLEVLQSGNL